MGLKKNKSIIGIYGLHQAIQIDCYPLIISLVADSSANTGKLVIFWMAQPNIAKNMALTIFFFWRVVLGWIGLFLDFGDELQKMVEPMVAALQDKH